MQGTINSTSSKARINISKVTTSMNKPKRLTEISIAPASSLFGESERTDVVEMQQETLTDRLLGHLFLERYHENTTEDWLNRYTAAISGSPQQNLSLIRSTSKGASEWNKNTSGSSSTSMRSTTGGLRARISSTAASTRGMGMEREQHKRRPRSASSIERVGEPQPPVGSSILSIASSPPMSANKRRKNPQDRKTISGGGIFASAHQGTHQAELLAPPQAPAQTRGSRNSRNNEQEYPNVAGGGMIIMVHENKGASNEAPSYRPKRKVKRADSSRALESSKKQVRNSNNIVDITPSASQNARTSEKNEEVGAHNFDSGTRASHQHDQLHASSATSHDAGLMKATSACQHQQTQRIILRDGNQHLNLADYSFKVVWVDPERELSYCYSSYQAGIAHLLSSYRLCLQALRLHCLSLADSGFEDRVEAEADGTPVVLETGDRDAEDNKETADEEMHETDQPGEEQTCEQDENALFKENQDKEVRSSAALYEGETDSVAPSARTEDHTATEVETVAVVVQQEDDDGAAAGELHCDRTELPSPLELIGNDPELDGNSNILKNVEEHDHDLILPRPPASPETARGLLQISQDLTRAARRSSSRCL
ncbi:unnamed protein product [Amoebophrya sp. A25]|nr:unnamed protein product [Amoebophrya sp. A25]|eukprot:GSA25T00020120001.1